ncbi:exonuclease domain-containing protein [Streptomyces sp. NPDC054847]
MTASPAVETTTLPVWAAADVPAHLRTKTELKEQRLKVAPGQEPVGYLRKYRQGHGWGEFPLYDPADAAPMRPLSAKQQAAKDARRTCPECGTLRAYIVHVRCVDCREKAEQARQELYTRTCRRCRRVAGQALPKDAHQGHACEHCRVLYAIRHQAAAERRAVWARTCPGRDCTVVTATDEEVAAGWDEDAAQEWRSWGWSPRWCPPCKERDTRERAERERQQREAEQRFREAREQEVRDLSSWAAAALEDPNLVVLDTETTGLEDDARIVDIAIVNGAGDVLMDTLVNPGEPIPADATSIHGITDTMTATAPTFSSILDQLTAALDGRRCLIYNRPYDVARLRHELTIHYRQEQHPDPEESADAWLDAMQFEDAMIPYSDWVGDWSDYWGNNTWQPLYGGDHRAVGDCRAVLERLREMAGKDLEDEAADAA